MNHSQVLLQIVVILCTAWLIGMVLRPLGQPFVVSEMLAGLVLGPTVLGAIAPGQQEQLFSLASLPALQGLVQLGVALFMFIMGLELRLPAGGRSMLRSAACVGTFSVLVPFGLGIAISPLLYAKFAPTGVGYWPFALFIAVSFSITAFPVLARIIKERAIGQTMLGQLAITAAAFADLLAWILVGFVLVFGSANSDTSQLLDMLGGLVLLVAVLFGIVRPLISRLTSVEATPSGGLVASILIGALTTAYLARHIKIDEVFGAFLFGLSLPRNDRLLRWFAERIEYFAVVLLMPVMFALAGLQTTPAAFSGDATGIFALILLTAVVGKIAGGYLGARLAGYSNSVALSTGALMNARGLMELIVIRIGLDAGLIGPELFTMFFVMAIVTTLMTGPLLSMFGRHASPVRLAPKN
jgi:Kef-type K+ transport system membrane component KefB